MGISRPILPRWLLAWLLGWSLAAVGWPAAAHAEVVRGPATRVSGAPAPIETGSTVEPVGVWPLAPDPPVLRGFDPPGDPWGRGHRGVDLGGRVGQPVRAALAGSVAYAGRLAGRGVVVVRHADGTRTTYEPVVASVRVGDTVRRGARIGSLQLTGSHCFPRACLHWGWLRGETYLNPLELVGAGPVRLLPLWRAEPWGS